MNTNSQLGLLSGPVQTERVQWLGLSACFILLLIILHLVSRRRIKESYSLVFIGACVFLGVLAIKRSLVDQLGRIAGIYYPPAALFLIISVVFFAFFLHLSIVITKLSNERRLLIQQLAILRFEFDNLKKKIQSSSSEK